MDPILTDTIAFVSLKGQRSYIMTTARNNRPIRTSLLRGPYYFVSFMGRYACGRPESC